LVGSDVSGTLERIFELVRRGEIRISDHGYEELVAEGIFVRDLITSLPEARLVEDYPDYPKGPCVLVLQRNGEGNPVHAVWGIPKGGDTPAVLITAYRPDPERWTDDFMRRKR
jgi:hypothetical protein